MSSNDSGEFLRPDNKFDGNSYDRKTNELDDNDNDKANSKKQLNYLSSATTTMTTTTGAAATVVSLSRAGDVTTTQTSTTNSTCSPMVSSSSSHSTTASTSLTLLSAPSASSMLQPQNMAKPPQPTSVATMVIMRPPPPPPPPLSQTISESHPSLSSTSSSTTTTSIKITSKISPDLVKKEEPTSSIPDLEFDGMTVLCRVCGDKASGFHYGVHSCEGCKGFFRRSIQQKIQYRPCTKNQQCSILRINRNRCQYCRLKKCIVVGMSRDAVRFGRVPKREKARMYAAMQQSTKTKMMEQFFCSELEDEQKLLATVVRAHLDTCDFTRIKIEPMLLQARQNPSYTICPPTLACPLNPNPQPLTGQQEMLQDFSKRFSPAIRGVVEFAKLIPGFALLIQEDQVTLLKAGVFEVLLVRLACLFDSETNTMVCLNGQVLKRESIHNSANARFLIDSMFDFAERINAMNLTEVELALFCAMVVIATDRPGLRNTELVSKIQVKLKKLLLTILKQNRAEEQTAVDVYDELNRKIPDLRTLNTLHSEKLLAFKMTEQQQAQLWPPILIDGTGSGTATATATTTTTTIASNHNNNSKYNKGLVNNNWQIDNNSMDTEIQSPLGSVSSTESYLGDIIESAPLLAASLAGNSNIYSPTNDSHHNHHHHSLNHNLLDDHSGRNRSNSAGSGSSTLSTASSPSALSSSSSADEDILMGNASHLIQNGLTITPVIRKVISNNVSSTNTNNNSNGNATNTAIAINTTTVFHKIDSPPSDSGIESGTEKFEKNLPLNGNCNSNSSSTSLCSSPRSSLEDHSETIIVTKCNRSSPQQQQQQQQQSPQQQQHSQSHQQQSQIDDMPVLKRVLQAPPLFDTNSLMDEAYKPHKKFRAFRVLTPATSPIIVKKEVVEADTLDNQHYHNNQQHFNNHQHQNHNHSHHHNQHQHQQPQQRDQQVIEVKKSSLSSTHSTLAKSLMETPKLTPEQRKRTDIINEYIMQGDFLNSCPYKKHANRSSLSPPSTEQKMHSQSHLQFHSQSFHSPPHSQHHPQSQQTNVIMNGRTYMSPINNHVNTTNNCINTLVCNSSSLSSPQPKSQSPHSTSSAIIVSKATRSLSDFEHGLSSLSSALAQQPLNLSKKSPSPSPISNTSSMQTAMSVEG